VSKQDTRFFDVFGVVIGLLVVGAIALFALARIVASHTQDRQVLSEAAYRKDVATRIAPPAQVVLAGQANSVQQVAVAGQDNSAPAAKAEATAAAAGSAAAAGMPKTGTELFEQSCNACHGQGIAGAPKAGDKAAWAPRIAQGTAMLYEHALKGFTGKTGMMPPKGGRMDAPDDLVKQAVDHMLEMAR